MTDADADRCRRILQNALVFVRAAEGLGPQQSREFRAGITQASLGIQLAIDVAEHGAPSTILTRRIADT